MRTKSKINSMDTWSWVHLFGCAFLVFAFRELGFGLLSSCIATFGLGILQELFDELRKLNCQKGKINLWDKFFDRRGFSWLDLAFDAGGIALSVVVILIF